MSNNELAEWLRLANMDLATAEHLFSTMHPAPLEAICFHCQQAAEKYIKAFYIFNEIEFPKTHDLSHLMNTLISVGIEVGEEYIDMCDYLIPFGVSIRYPYDLELTKENADTALHYASALALWITSTMQN